MTDNRALRELVDRLRESANVDLSTSQNKDLAEWVRDRANGSAAGKRHAADELAAILVRPVAVTGEELERACKAYIAAYTIPTEWKKAMRAALESMVRGKS